jgi:hypothetical protein
MDYQHVSTPPLTRRATLESNPFESKGSRVILVGFIVGLAVIAGGYGLAIKRGINPVAVGRNLISSVRNWDAPPPTTQFSVSDKVTKVEIGGPSAPAAKVEPTTKVESAISAVRGVDPSKLPAVGAAAVAPAEPTDIGSESKAAKSVKAPKAVAEAPAPKAEPAPRPAPAPVARAEKPEPKPEPVRAEPAPKEPEPTGLAGAIKKAAGPIEAAKPVSAEREPPAPAIRGDIPETPSQGALMGAIGSHRTTARQCLDGYDAASRATINFASSGQVESVNVAGPAAGTKAEACIVRALSKANVGPFRRPTMSITVSITPP